MCEQPTPRLTCCLTSMVVLVLSITSLADAKTVIDLSW